MIYKYLTHPLYCHMTLTEGDFCSSKDTGFSTFRDLLDQNPVVFAPLLLIRRRRRQVVFTQAL